LFIPQYHNFLLLMKKIHIDLLFVHSNLFSTLKTMNSFYIIQASAIKRIQILSYHILRCHFYGKYLNLTQIINTSNSSHAIFSNFNNLILNSLKSIILISLCLKIFYHLFLMISKQMIILMF
jgi:hypothetical protein